MYPVLVVARTVGSQLFAELLLSVGRILTSPSANSASVFKITMHFI